MAVRSARRIGWVAALALLASGGAAVSTSMAGGAAAATNAPAQPAGSGLAAGKIAGSTTAAGGAGQSSSATPLASVQSFIAAEARGDHARSYTYLASAEKRDHGSVAAWVAAHANMVRLRGAERLETDPITGERAVVRGVVRLTAGLDEVRGLVPERAEARFALVRESGAWRITWKRSELVPLYIDDASAPGAVKEWAEARRRCVAPANEYRAGLVGFPSLAARLCRAGVAVDVGAPATIERLKQLGLVVSAFGPSATEWARVVPLTKPVPMNVVVAPVGPRWMVVALTPA